jgi:hypothetical protein
MSKSWWASSLLVPTLLVLSLGVARGQDEEPNNGEPIPLPFTRSALKGMYKKGLLLRYQQTVHQRGKRPAKTFILNEVMSHSGKGYSVRTLNFNAAGTAIGKPKAPQSVPYRVESKTFRVAKQYAYERIRIAKKERSAHKYVYEIKLGGRPATRTVWYSGKHRGLLLKTVVRPAGNIGKSNYTVLKLMAIPGKLGGPKVMGAPQGNLPWSDKEIMQAWPQGGWVEYEVKTSGKKSQTLRLKQTLMGRERSCYYMREQLWASEGGKPKETGRPRLWDTWLGKVRSAPKSALKKKLDKEVEAAGRKWPCKVFAIEGKQTITWYLSKEVPGLTVRYVSQRKGEKVDRLLSKVGVPIPGSK